MSTPTFDSSAPLDVHEVARLLEETTPEPTFRSEAGHSSKWLCEIKHSGLAASTINKCRSQIEDDEYWKRETQYFKAIHDKVVFENLLKQSTTDRTDWRRMAVCYRRRLTRQGVDAERFQELRRSIPEESYWRPEEKCFRRFSAKQEAAMRAQLQGAAASRRRRTCPPETEDASDNVQPPTDQRRMTRSTRVEKRPRRKARR